MYGSLDAKPGSYLRGSGVAITRWHTFYEDMILPNSKEISQEAHFNYDKEPKTGFHHAPICLVFRPTAFSSAVKCYNPYVLPINDQSPLGDDMKTFRKDQAEKEVVSVD